MVVVSGLLKALRNKYRQRVDSRLSLEAAHEDAEYAKYLNISPLSESEKMQINEKWGGIVPNVKLGYPSFEIFKALGRFDVNYLPKSYYDPYITTVLNPREYMKAFSNKGLLYSIFGDIKQPQLVLRNVKGGIYDSQNVSMSIKDAASIISGYDKGLIIKPSVDSGLGKNVTIIKPDSTIDKVLDILHFFNEDYVVQEMVEQSSVTAQFNPTSLNTMRIITILINGEFSICRHMLRCGAQGSFVDNGRAGGTMIGINKDGTFNKFGYTFDNKVLEIVNGCKLDGLRIPRFEYIKQVVKKAHMHIPTCSLVGWDFALDKDGEPVLIEANLHRPGTQGIQISTGPFFGERTDEVIEYVKNHRKK